MVKKISQKGRMFARIAALAALFQGGCAVLPQSENDKANHTITQTAKQGLKLKDMTSEEEIDFKSFVVSYSQKSPTARQVLKDLARLGTTIEYFEKEQDEGDMFDAGLSDENVLSLNRLMFEKGVPFDDTFFHESEHVLHVTEAHRHGINGASFRSLDDVYIYGTIMEALAYRKAALCCTEYTNGPEGYAAAHEVADAIFLKRLSADNKVDEEREAYENAAFYRKTFETNMLPNQVYFRSEPDWNHIVTVMSRGEVTEVPVLPKPTPRFLHLCILNELEKNPNLTNPEDFDLSCVLKNRSSLTEDESRLKKAIADLLGEVYVACEKTGKSFENDTQYAFLYLMGWPNDVQMMQIQDETVSFDEARDANLSQIPMPELFDSAIRLIESPDVQAFDIYETQNYAKMLRLEQQILYPQQRGLVRNNRKTR